MSEEWIGTLKSSWYNDGTAVEWRRDEPFINIFIEGSGGLRNKSCLDPSETRELIRVLELALAEVAK